MERVAKLSIREFNNDANVDDCEANYTYVYTTECAIFGNCDAPIVFRLLRFVYLWIYYRL